MLLSDQPYEIINCAGAAILVIAAAGMVLNEFGQSSRCLNDCWSEYCIFFSTNARGDMINRLCSHSIRLNSHSIRQ